jgi:hypothetical protein
MPTMLLDSSEVELNSTRLLPFLAEIYLNVTLVTIAGWPKR